MFEDDVVSTRKTRGQHLAELVREDLELYGVSELQERIADLQAEIQRTEAQLARKQSGRSAADALFGASTG